MAMSGLAQWALNNLVAYGLPILLVVSYAGSLGIPFPISMVMIAAGAFAHEGFFDWRLALLACVAGASLADHSEYLLGRLAGRWLTRRFGEKFVWQQAQSTINRQGGWAILLTRFWLTPLAPAINLIAGSRYPYPRFLLIDVAGQILWVLMYGGLGYIFASQWQKISQTMGSFSALSVGLVLLIFVIYLLARRFFQKSTTR